jgi:hypothetical protein
VSALTLSAGVAVPRSDASAVVATLSALLLSPPVPPGAATQAAVGITKCHLPRHPAHLYPSFLESMSVLRGGIHSPPRHPTHVDPSFFELIGMI